MNFFSSTGSNVNEKQTKSLKNGFFFKDSKRSERMAQGKPQLKFETNPSIRNRDKIHCRTDGRMADKLC